jgi:VanZ family protein
VPPGLRPETPVPHSLEHSAIFFATGAAFAGGYNLSRSQLAIFLVIFSGAVEIAQLFVAGRHARMADLIVDTVASLGGLMFISLIKKFRH